MKFHPLADIFPLIEGDEFKSLVGDIAEHGLRQAVISYEGQILDGRNRWRACQEIGLTARVEPYLGDDPKGFVLSLNLSRRHLTASQKAAVAVKIEEYEAVKAKERQSTLNNPTIGKQSLMEKIPQAEQGKAREKAAAAVGVNEHYVSDAKKIKTEDPETFEKLLSGKVTIKDAKRKLRKIERKKEAETIAANVPALAERYELHNAPCIEALGLEEGSVDIVVTDPPYPQEYLHLFTGLGQVAEHVLKPGGLAVVMVGQTYLPDIMTMLGKHLDYHWTVAYLMPGGQAVQQFPRKANTFWKPVLVYSKGKYEGDWFGDVAKSDTNDNDKEHHHWGQSASGMRDLMRRFVMPGSVVLDPFLGGGTTAIVALEMGASFIGYDTEAEALISTRARIGEIHAAVV